MSSSFSEKVVKSAATPIHFIVCKDTKGRQAHYFIMCSHQKLRMIREIKEGAVDLAHYGHIVAAGFGSEPSPETIAMLKEKYDFDFVALSNKG